MLGIVSGQPLRIDLDAARPITRGDCRGAQRPCPFVGCRHHLYLDVNPVNGSIRINFPDREIEDLADTCSLDVADRGAATLEATGRRMNIVRERVRQIELSARASMRARGAAIR